MIMKLKQLLLLPILSLALSACTITVVHQYPESSSNNTSTSVSSSSDTTIKLTSIEVHNMTQEYHTGDAFSFDGVCIAHYENKEDQEVSPKTISSPSMSKEGGRTIEVTYEDEYGQASTSYEVNILPRPVSLWEIREHYDEYEALNDMASTYHNTIDIVVTALVVGIQDDNVFLRDVLLSEEQYQKEGSDALLSGMYGFVGFNSAFASKLKNFSKQQGMDGTGIGVIIRIHCNAAKYNGNIQLSNITTTTGEDFESIKHCKSITSDNFDEYKEEFKWSHKYAVDKSVAFNDLSKDVNPITNIASNIDSNNVASSTLPYIGQWVQLDLEICTGFEPNTTNICWWYYENYTSSTYFIYSKFIGKNGEEIRCNMYFYNGISVLKLDEYWGTKDKYDVNGTDSPVGHKWRITGFLSYNDQEIQLEIGSIFPEYNYIEKLS